MPPGSSHPIRFPHAPGLAAVTALAGVLWFAAPAAAHHSAAPHFDLEKTLTLDGVVTKLEFVNPHAYVYFTVTGADGKPVPWRCELAARTSLERLGWSGSTFVPGQKVQIKGAPARREANVCMLTSFVREDGAEVSRNQDLNAVRAPAAPVATRPVNASRPDRLPDGRPNLSGPWVAAGRAGGPGRGRPGGPGGPAGPGRGGPGRGPGGPPRPETTDAGDLAAKQYDQRFDDPALKCDPANIIFGWVHDQHVNDIVQKGNQVILQYGYMDFVRTINMNATHPARITPSTGGHSTGSWDGDVLVVDTIGFKPSVLIPIIGVMHSAQMHVVERFSVDPVAKTLTRAYRAEDPLYLKAPYTGTDVMTLTSEPRSPYQCVELSGKNNERPK